MIADRSQLAYRLILTLAIKSGDLPFDLVHNFVALRFGGALVACHELAQAGSIGHQCGYE
jgi:ABC-type glycerol-3-phosphate transport system substrate-binding protein